MDFQFITTPSLDFQVALNLGETLKDSSMEQSYAKSLSMGGLVSKI